MEKAVVTGATGFIGRHLVAALRERGVHVSTPGRIFTAVRCDVIYHLACPSTTVAITTNPLSVMDTILDATRSAMSICPSALFVNASSFGALDVFDDTPQGAYNVAKRCMETYLHFSGRQHINYRIPSVYGEDMHDDNFIKRCVDGTAYFPTEPNKPYYIAHVDDVVDAMVQLTPICVEEITLGQVYEQFNSGWRGLHRPAVNPQTTTNPKRTRRSY